MVQNITTNENNFTAIYLKFQMGNSKDNYGLGETKQDNEEENQVLPLPDDEFDERVTRFAGENGGVMYVVKKKEEVEGT